MRWQKNIQTINCLSRWLKTKDSFSNKIENIGKLKISELKFFPIKILHDEKVFFDKKYERSLYLREVVIFANEIPVMYARTVLPKNYLRGFWGEIKRLRNGSLSEIVFNNNQTLRSNFIYKKPSRNDNFTKRLDSLGVEYRDILAIRQSIFNYKKQQTLLTEVFLQNIKNLKYNDE
jgi:chorismate--pyruvate lyase